MSRFHVMVRATQLRLRLAERIAPPGAIVLPPPAPHPDDRGITIYEPKDEADRDRYLAELHEEHQRSQQ